MDNLDVIDLGPNKIFAEYMLCKGSWRVAFVGEPAIDEVRDGIRTIEEMKFRSLKEVTAHVRTFFKNRGFNVIQ